MMPCEIGAADYLILSLLAVALLSLASIPVLLYDRHVTSYRRGFRAAVDFLEGDREELPPEIKTWQGALRESLFANPKDHV